MEELSVEITALCRNSYIFLLKFQLITFLSDNK
jgi:hypothetical protein